MNRTLTKKLMYVIVVVAMLAMLIPAIPVSATPSITMQLVSPIAPHGLTADGGYNIKGSVIQLSSNETVTWALNPSPGPANFVAPATNPATSIQVLGDVGEVTITATNSNGVASANKKWGTINRTYFTQSNGASPVTWNEDAKVWTAAPVTVEDNVIGTFGAVTNPMQGVIMNWYLIRGDIVVDLSPEEFLDHLVNGTMVDGLQTRMEGYAKPNHVSFADWGPLNANAQVTFVQNVTDINGKASVTLYAKGEEAVQVVVVPEYPGDPQILITPELYSWDFYTTEAEVVPQVRWAGEKIVLEKYFGTSYNGNWVKFNLQNQSVGALEGISGTNYNQQNGATVWAMVTNGFASCILVSSDEGVSNVTAGLYNGTGPESGTLINQHFFAVYFLKFESVKLGDVVGKRCAHNAGKWDPPNPWSAIDTDTQLLNVSQDALLRATVKGWFITGAANVSVRPERTVDPTNSTLDNPSTATLTLPAKRWILPDDWAVLAGPNWEQSRLHWDIMCTPDGSVTATDPLGVYKKGTKDVSGSPVIGPFSPGLELMTATGWDLTNRIWDSNRAFGNPSKGIQTVVPDGVLNKYDAPMPAAKIIFTIQAGASTNRAGFFKSAAKTDIYYLGDCDAPWTYTNPFYQTLIPAHEAIPPFINNGGYDWDSFDTSYGPYIFWEIINQTSNNPPVATSDPAGHPTVAEVYSDNHGEAMIWLNGNWNLDLSKYFVQAGSVDVPINAVVGTTTIQATADYPYSRLHNAFQSNKDTKTWTWGGQILGTDGHLFPGNVQTDTAITQMLLSVGTWDGATIVGTRPNQAAKSDDKMVWVWVTDRDGLKYGVNGAKVTWDIAVTDGGAQIPIETGDGISQYNEITKNIDLVNGFLAGTNGVITDGSNRTEGYSFLREPTSWEKMLFNKFWGSGYTGTDPTDVATYGIHFDALHPLGLNPDNFVVAAIKVINLAADYSTRANVTMTIQSHDFDLLMPQATIGTLIYNTNIDFNVAHNLDDGIRVGDANCDGVVNMGDVTAVERMILGYSQVTTNAVLNDEGTVDMGTVVKIERAILGLK